MVSVFAAAAYNMLPRKYRLGAKCSYEKNKPSKTDRCTIGKDEETQLTGIFSENTRTGDEALDENQNTSAWEAAWNLTNMIEGTGLLALPYAILKGGYAAIVGILLVAVISNYTGHVIIRCLYEENKQGRLLRVRNTYENIGRDCWPRFGGKIVLCLQIIELMSVSTLYLVLCGSLLTDTFPNSHVTELQWIIVGSAVVLPSVFLRTLSHVSWLSFISTVAMLGTVISVTGYGALHSSEWILESIPGWKTDTVAVSIGVIIFSYAAHPLLPGLESSMIDRRKFPLMMNLSFLFATLVKLVFALCAYLTFTSGTKDVIINNLPLGVTHTIVSLLLVFNVLFSYAFPMFTVIQSIEKNLLIEPCSSKVIQCFDHVALRLILVLVTLCSALLIPHFALLMAFIGSFTGACLVFIFPCLFQIQLQGHEMRFYHIFFNCFIILGGSFLGLIGMACAGSALAVVYGII